MEHGVRGYVADQRNAMRYILSFDGRAENEKLIRACIVAHNVSYIKRADSMMIINEFVCKQYRYVLMCRTTRNRYIVAKVCKHYSIITLNQVWLGSSNEHHRLVEMVEGDGEFSIRIVSNSFVQFMR